MKDYLEHLELTSSQHLPKLDVTRILVIDAKYHVSTEKRPLDVYEKIGDQNENTY